MSRLKDVFDQITEDRNKRGNGTAQATGTTNSPRSNLEKAMERINRQREAEQERKKREEEEAAVREEQLPQEPAEPERKPRPIPAVVPEQAEGAAQASRDLLQRQRTMAAYDRQMRTSLPDGAMNKAMAARAKEEYDNYLASDEYKREKVSQGVDSASNEAEYYAALAGKGTQTDREKELKARADYYENQAIREKEEAMLRRDMDEIDAMTEAERGMLARYIIEREQEKFNLLSEPSFRSARYNAAELFNKYGAKRVQELAESYGRWQNRNTAEETARTAAQSAGKGVGGAIGQSAASVGASLLGAMTAPLGYLGEVMDRTGRYTSMDPHNIGNLPNVYAGAVREQVAEDIAGDGSNPLRKGLSYAYQGGMSALDSGARLLAAGGNPAVAMGLAAAGSFGQEVSEASKQGASPMEALGHGAASATIEALTEKLPLDELVKTAKGGGKGVAQAITSALKQAGIETTTEEISLLGSLASEAAILREKSAYKQRIGELVTGGMSYQQAREQADREILEQAKQTAIVSGMSGGMSSLGASVAGNLSDRLGGPQTAETARGETAQDTAETGHQAFLNRMLQGIRPKPQEAEAPKPEGLQRVDATYQATMGVETNQADNTREGTDRTVRGIRYQSSKVNAAILDMVDRVKKGLCKGNEKVHLGAVSDSNAAKIQEETGIDVQGYTVAIEARQIDHILRRHGENGAANRSMENPEDIAKMEYALNDPDSIRKAGTTQAYVTNRDGKMKPADTVLYEKMLEDGSYYVVQAVPETKKRTLYIVSAFIGESGYKNTEAPQSTNVNGPGATPEAESAVTSVEALQSTDANYLSATPDGESASASINSIPNGGGNVNAENAPQNAPEGFEAMGAAQENGFGRNTVGAGESQFHHEVRRSKTYDNTFANATDRRIRAVGKESENLDPHVAEYDYVSEKESRYNARQRLGEYSAEEVQAEFEDLVQKTGWTGEDNDTAMLLLKHLMKTGQRDKLRVLAKVQKERGTSAAQMVQSFAKYTRYAMTPEKACADAVNVLGDYTPGDVDSRFYRKFEGKNRKDRFDTWRKEIEKSVLEIGNEIDDVTEGDAQGMQDIVRQLANFRRTTAWAGNTNRLTKAAERIVGKLDYETAKDIATAQLAMIPEDFRRRSAGEQVKTVRIQNMLSALTTVNRNLAGNATIGMMDALSDSTGGRMMDMLMSKFTGKRTVGNDVRYAKEYFTAARDAADMAALCVELDIPLDTDAAYSVGKTRSYSPSSGTVGRFFSAYEKYLKYALEVTDKFFEGGTTGAVSKGLQNLGEKSGLSQAEIDSLARKAGERRTYKEGRALARANTGLKKALNNIGTEDFGAGDLLIPFAGVPGDVAQVGVDYSGVGLVEGFAEAVRLIKDVREGRYVNGVKRVPKKNDPGKFEEIRLIDVQRKAATDFGRGMTGVGLIAAFTTLAAMGVIGVHDDEDWDKSSLEQSMGLSGAQINVDAALRAMRGESTEWQGSDLLISVDFLQPFNAQMYVGYLTAQEESVRDMITHYPENAFMGILQSVLDMPMMQTFSDTADIVASLTEVQEDGDFSAMQDAAGKLAGDTLSGFIPSWMRQTAQYIDPYYRDTAGKNAMEKAANQFVAAVPFASRTLPKKFDGLGNVQMRYDNPVEGFFDTFISPTDTTRIKGSEIADFLDDMSGRTRDKSIYPEYTAPKSFKVNGESITVTGQMRETYQKTYGDHITALYGALMQSGDFEALSEDQQVEALKKAKEYATQFAKAAVSDYSDIQEGTTDEISNAIVNKVALGGITDGIDSLKDAWRKGYDTGELMQDLERAYEVYTGLSYETRTAVLENASGAVKSYIEERESGSTTEEYTKIQMPTLLLGDGMDALSTAIKEGADTSAALSDLEEVYALYSKLEPLDKRAVLEKVSTKAEYYLEARAAKVSGDTFAQLYETFTSIDNTDAGEFDKAETWAHALQKAKEAGRINQSQVDKLKDSMRFWQIIPAEADDYNKLVDNGVNADIANKVMKLLDGIVGTGTKNKETGKATVRDVDEWEALSEAGFLSESERDNVIKLYMPDYDPTAKQPDKTELKYDYARQEWGISAEDYMDAYRVQVDYSKKEEKMVAWKALGFTDQEVENLWLLFGATGKNRIDVEAWYEGQ